MTQVRESVLRLKKACLARQHSVQASSSSSSIMVFPLRGMLADEGLGSRIERLSERLSDGLSSHLCRDHSVCLGGLPSLPISLSGGSTRHDQCHQMSQMHPKCGHDPFACSLQRGQVVNDAPSTLSLNIISTKSVQSSKCQTGNNGTTCSLKN